MEQEISKRKNTFYLSCYLKRSNALKTGEAPIYLRITVNKQVAVVSLQGNVPPNLWDQAKERSRAKDKSAIELNNYINSAKAKITTIFRELELDGKPITAQLLKDMYLGNHVVEEIGRTLNEVHSEHNERCRKLLGVEYSQSTIYKFDTSLKYLQEFMTKELDMEDIPLKDINEDFIRKYELYLKTEKGCANNSAIKHLKTFKKITRIALLNDWLPKDPFVSIKFRQDEVHTDFLTMLELEALMNKNIATKRLSQIRDVFVFCCFTGLAFVDVKNLKQEHIIKNSADEMWIRKSREKTNNMCNIPLLNIPKSDGYNFIEHKRFFETEMPQHLVKATQLFRTLPHEFGHYVHYLEIVERPTEEDEDIEEWERLREIYHALPSVEKESFAHNYADRLREKLLAENLIPF